MKKTTNSLNETLIELMNQLPLKTAASELPNSMTLAQRNNWSYGQWLEHLLNLEWEAKDQRSRSLRLKQAKLPEVQTIDQFQFDFHASRKSQKASILQLMDLNFVAEQKDVILIGNPGVGKSFLANCIGYQATQKKIRTLYVSVMEMINKLIAAQADHTLLKELKTYQDPELLLIDELGFLPLGEEGSHLFFQVISARHKHKSTLITTNLPFSSWPQILHSNTVASAIADRLVFNSVILVLQGESFRRKSATS